MDRCARPFTGQLRDLTRVALDQHGIAVKRLQWMGQHDNHLFCCDTADGERLVVRVLCRRLDDSAEVFCAIRSYLATATRHGIGWLEALTMATEGKPFIPEPA